LLIGSDLLLFELVQLLEQSECLFELLLGLLKLLSLVEKLAESFALLDTLDAGKRFIGLNSEHVLMRK